ncbi:MAG TPA: biotin carboxylase N-terminal domain-containing protein [Thermomicrobiales bacterium]|nr:biotin carboxylase N-terminal domain-containing protein [Thermomicrobiales bacterium]
MGTGGGLPVNPTAALTGKRVAIANRGEIAVRIAATCRRLGAVPILLVGEPDLEGFAARQVGRVEVIGEAGSELDVSRVVGAARRARAEFLHPGYGFLSERAALADACAEAGIRFVGPSAATLRLCGDKLATRAAAERAGVPVLPASSPLGDDPATWQEAARDVGYPLLVKPAGAGGGRGLRHVAEEFALAEAVLASRRESASSGAGALVYLERELVAPRHVEVQLVADGQQTVALGDRDCSLQRRHQKVIEEAPAPNVDAETRRALHAHARRIAEEVDLRGIATCEFLLGGDGVLAFLEVNPRIQVEHPVTELVTGIDLVEWQLLIAAGSRLPERTAPSPRGHAIEARVYAEDPGADFFPAPGRLATVSWPVRPDVRVDAGYTSDDVIPAAYDPLLAKVIAHGADRESAIAVLRVALLDTVVAGVPTNISWLVNLLDHEAVRSGRATTRTAGDVALSMPDRSLVPIAAVAHMLDGSPSAPVDPWSAIGPWRMSGRVVLTVHGDDWEERAVVWRTAAGWEATIGTPPIPIRWWRDPAGIWTIGAADTVVKMAVIECGDVLEVYGSGGRWLVRPGPKPAGNVARQQRPSDGRVLAPLPASVLGIHVDVGDRVARGQPLVTLNAMKMELVCEAPVAGVVEAISCRIDELVAADDVLVNLRIADVGVPGS